MDNNLPYLGIIIPLLGTRARMEVTLLFGGFPGGT